MKKILVLSLTLAVLCLSLAGCSDNNDSKKPVLNSTQQPELSGTQPLELPESAVELNSEINRGNLLEQLMEIEKKYQQNPDDKTITLDYAEKLFQLGDFSKSQETIKSLLNDEKPSPQAIYLSANIEYLTGNYSQSEVLFGMLIEQYPDEYKTSAEVGLLFTYYQTNQYQKSQNLFEGLEGQIELPLWDFMKGFGDEVPYQIDWNGNDEVTVPFLSSKPVPIVPIEINGKKVNAAIDNGGDAFIIDDVMAHSLGINSITAFEGDFSGGEKSEVGYGRANTLVIGGVTLKSVPVMLGQPSEAFRNDEFDIDGIIGTQVLKQFLPTIDYLSGQLILRPRNEVGKNALKTELAQDKMVAEQPFTLAATHYMISKGSINGMDGFNIFVDSGLDDWESKAALALPKETMDYIGIDLPEMEDFPEDIPGGMGGADYQIGRYDVNMLNIGSAQMNNTGGVYGTFSSELYYNDLFGFLIDGMVGDLFVSNYKWTIDFDAMTMIFSQ